MKKWNDLEMFGDMILLVLVFTILWGEGFSCYLNNISDLTLCQRIKLQLEYQVLFDYLKIFSFVLSISSL